MMRKYGKNNDKSLKLTTLGFTLVELLAVIVILSVILVVGVTTLVSNIKEKKQVASKQVYELIKSAARNYEIDYDIRKRQSLPISDLCERYIGCPIIDPSTNEEIWGYISIGDDEYKFLSEIKFDWELNGGTTSQKFQHTYIPYTSIILLDPVKEGNEFSEWKVVKGNSILDGNILTIGDTDTLIYAVWKAYPTLTVVLGEGATTSQSFETSYKSGTTIELINPTREGYTFADWEVTSGSILSGNTLTIGSEDTTLTALWIINYTINYNLNGGTKGTNAPTFGASGSTVTVSNPTKTGYKFTGWTVSGTDAAMSGTSLTIGTSDITLTANWEIASPVYSYSCANGSAGSSPYVITYTGNCKVIDDTNNNWRVKFLTSGTLTLASNTSIDAFLVGGGGGGAHDSSTTDRGGGGGGGGYTKTFKNIAINAGTGYSIVIGNGGAGSSSGRGGDGETTSAFGKTASGGKGGIHPSGDGGAGGSGGGGGGYGSKSAGAGGSNGGNGTTATGIGGTGQGTTTREFGESSGALYAGGGGGGAGSGTASSNGSGGSGGGGSGGKTRGHGTANTGGGGGGEENGSSSSQGGGNGGSGIVVIRNAR